MLDSVFKAYDVRAVHPDPLSTDVARRIGWGAADWFIEQSGKTGGDVTIAVGHDMRLSSPELVEALEPQALPPLAPRETVAEVG